MRLLFLLTLLAPWFAKAQPASVSGRVADESGGVAFASVALLREGRQVAGTASDTAGRFRLSADTGRYTLAIRHVGHTPLQRSIRLGAEGLDLGVLRLAPAEIGPVTVAAEAVTRVNDRFVIAVDDTPLFAGRNGEELLRLAPGVRVGDDGISIQGASGAQVYVDGRRQKGSPEQTAAYLRSLPASEVARIEVIPQAGPEFAADARGGVILITLRRRRTRGMDAGVQAAAGLGRHLQTYAPSARIGVHAGRWTLNASGSGSFTPESSTRFDETRSYPFRGTTLTAGRMTHGRGEFAAICDLSPRHTTGLAVEYSARSLRMPTAARTEHFGTTTDSRYLRHAGDRTLTLTANSLLRLDTLGSEVKLIVDYTRFTAEGDTHYGTIYADDGAVRDSTYRSDARSRYDLLTVDAGLTRRLGGDLTLRAGARYVRNGMEDASRYEAQHRAVWIGRPEYGYDTRYVEQTGAVYASLAWKHDRWDLAAGLRGEYAAIDAPATRREGFDLFPHLSVSRALNGLRTWMVSAQWSRHIERPAFASLNPARIQLSEYSYQTGNPSLRPTFIHRFSLTLVWRYRYVLSVGGNLHRDLIREAASVDAAHPDVVGIRPENHHTENHWFAFLALPLKLSRRWELRTNVVGVVQRIRPTARDAAATHPLLFADLTTTFDLPAAFYLEAECRFQSRLYSANSQVGPRCTLAASVKKRLCDKRLTLFFTVQNLTDSGWEYVSETDGMRRLLRGRQAGTGRLWKIGATWSFHSGERFRARKVESAVNRSRLVKTERQSK